MLEKYVGKSGQKHIKTNNMSSKMGLGEVGGVRAWVGGGKPGGPGLPWAPPWPPRALALVPPWP